MKQHLKSDLFWFGILLVITFLFVCTKCNAQAHLDTMMCKTECIKDFIVMATKENSGRDKIYVIYDDVENNISDIIPVTKTTYEYILQCKRYHIEPTLGIKLKNGQIQSIIKYKPTYRRKQ